VPLLIIKDKLDIKAFVIELNCFAVEWWLELPSINIHNIHSVTFQRISMAAMHIRCDLFLPQQMTQKNRKQPAAVVRGSNLPHYPHTPRHIWAESNGSARARSPRKQSASCARDDLVKPASAAERYHILPLSDRPAAAAVANDQSHSQQPALSIWRPGWSTRVQTPRVTAYRRSAPERASSAVNKSIKLFA